MVLIAKGQLISKCHFGVIVSTKRPTKFAHEIFRLTCVYQVIFLLKDFFFKKKKEKYSLGSLQSHYKIF